MGSSDTTGAEFYLSHCPAFRGAGFTLRSHLMICPQQHILSDSSGERKGRRRERRMGDWYLVTSVKVLSRLGEVTCPPWANCWGQWWIDWLRSGHCPHHGACSRALPYYRGPQPPCHRPIPVCGLLGTRPRSRRWAVGEQVKLHLPLPIPRITAWTIPAPHRSHYHLNHPTAPVHGKIVFHITGPWRQKGWGPLPYY